MHVQYLLGTKHYLPLSHMDKSYIWLEETNQRINDFSIGYMKNPNFIIDKYFKAQVKIYVKNTFGTMAQQHISKILSKTNTKCYHYLCFIRPDKKNKETFQSVELCNLYNYKQLCLY